MQLSPLIQEFKVSYRYPVVFTHDAFNTQNSSIIDVLGKKETLQPSKFLVVIDQGIKDSYPFLAEKIKDYCKYYSDKIVLVTEPITIPGGEECKNQPELVSEIEKAVNDFKIDRHSYIVAIGGGAVLDLVGFAAAVSHRGIRLIRIPTTVLSQNDSGVGVKNSINAFKKKNFLGTFAPPFAVINDFDFLKTLDDRNWRAGIAEAIKVSLIKDKTFFDFLKDNIKGFVSRDMEPMRVQIHKCAELHLNHIASGDPFEMGSSRPLDFGHWSAHKLEQLTNFSVLHGEAVAMGIALDSIYSYKIGWLSKEEVDEIIDCIFKLGFPLYHDKLSSNLDNPTHHESILKGLVEFQEHLGGRLTIMLLEKIGKGKEVNEIDFSLMRESIKLLEQYASERNAKMIS
jgi:3-dehydroquinate synthase